MGHVEARYYFTKAMEKWYVGANLGLGVYNMQKWNYWSLNDRYQKGFNYMIGGTVGYQLKLSDRWNIDFMWEVVHLRVSTTDGIKINIQDSVTILHKPGIRAVNLFRSAAEQ